MQNIYTVKQVNAYIKNMFTQDFMLSRIYVKGEVSNCKYHSSGHIYFSLKDESGTIACVMFAGQRSGLSFRISEGQQVVVLGNMNTYERTGSYQLYAKEIILDGAGLLYEKFQALKKELEEMGMFAKEYKRPIPKYVRTLGIVTASTGAAVQDIINVATRRNPYIHLILYPAKVQGEGAAESVVSGIQALTKLGVDVMIVGRGGGSIEDLWAFNEEIVARAIFECEIPIISAVGHETDTTIADYVADLRAPTPSAAAELAVFELAKLENLFMEYQMTIQRLMLQKTSICRNQLTHYETKFKYLHPRSKLQEKKQLSADIEETLRRCMREALRKKRHQLEIYIESLKGLSPLTKLNQGFSYVETSDGKTVKSVNQICKDASLRIHVSDGMISAKVTDISKEKTYE